MSKKKSLDAADGVPDTEVGSGPRTLLRDPGLRANLITGMPSWISDEGCSSACLNKESVGGRKGTKSTRFYINVINICTCVKFN